MRQDEEEVNDVLCFLAIAEWAKSGLRGQRVREGQRTEDFSKRTYPKYPEQEMLVGVDDNALLPKVLSYT